MNLPGNNDIGTDDRAKLLKYGAYEIIVCSKTVIIYLNDLWLMFWQLLRLASRYDKYSESLLLSNESQIREQDLHKDFGPYQAHLLFRYFNSVHNLALSPIHYALVSAILYFNPDRPSLSERHKCQLIQGRYLQLLEFFLREQYIEPTVTNNYTAILLSMIKLRQLDLLSKFIPSLNVFCY